MEHRARTKVRLGALLVLALVALGVYALDQLSKFLVVSNLTEGDVVRVLGDVLQLHFVRNPGAAFSLASGMTWIFSLIATAVVVFIIWFARRIRSLLWSVVFGLLLGGVLGNLTDRFIREPSFGLGHVVDFISTPWLIPAIYNVADMCIVSSMVIFMILTIRGVGLDGKRMVGKSAGDSPAQPVDPAQPVSPAQPVDPAQPADRPAHTPRTVSYYGSEGEETVTTHGSAAGGGPARTGRPFTNPHGIEPARPTTPATDAVAQPATPGTPASTSVAAGDQAGAPSPRTVSYYGSEGEETVTTHGSAAGGGPAGAGPAPAGTEPAPTDAPTSADPAPTDRAS